VKRFSLLLFCASFLFFAPLYAFGETIIVHDGTSTTVDVDWWTETKFFSANWSSVDWSAAGIFDKWYQCVLWDEDGNEVQPRQVQDILPSATPPTSVTFTDLPLQVGVRYWVEVTAWYQEAGGPAAIDVPLGSGASDGAVIGSPPDPFLSLDLSSSPSTLTFSSTETALSVDLQITATATGSIEVTSIQEEWDYTSWGTETSPSESLSLTIPGGTTATLSRTVTLSSLQRSKALGSGTVGGFSLDYTVSGVDTVGDPVEGRISIPVTVHAGLPSSLSVSAVSLDLPPSPYYVGDVISNPTVTVHATGSGVVQGQVLVDGSLSWSSTPSFTVSVNGTTSFPISGTMPTSGPGTHTVRVELSTPGGFSDDQTYTVSGTTPPFPPSTLVLVPGVAELTNLSGSAFVTSAPGYEEYSFSGTATLRLPSLGGAELTEATVSSLEVRYEDSAPTVAQIRGGTVEKLAVGSEVLAAFADDTLRIKRVFFEGEASPATDHILVDAMLYLPELAGTELLPIEGLVVRTGGVEDQELRWSPGDGKAFTAFGLEFKLHDVGATPAFQFAEDSTHGHAYTLAGSLHMDEKVTVTPVQQQLTEFTNLRL